MPEETTRKPVEIDGIYKVYVHALDASADGRIPAQWCAMFERVHIAEAIQFAPWRLSEREAWADVDALLERRQSEQAWAPYVVYDGQTWQLKP